MQENHVISYESKKLKEHKKNYATNDLELDSIIYALKMWGHYLIGKIFLLKNDNLGLKYLFKQPNLNGKQTRWLDFLSDYNFEVKYIKGKETGLSMH